MFITAAPTLLPTISPSNKPTSTIPSTAPTITGEVASVSLSGSITENMSMENIDAITSNLAEIYGVDISDVESSVDYVISGTLNVTIPENIPEEDAIILLEQSISDVLGVHPKDLIVTISEDGEVSYSVTGESYEEIEEIQDIASNISFASDITAALIDNNSDMIVESSSIRDEIEIVISATVDTTDATGTAGADSAIFDLANEYDLTDSSVQGKIPLLSNENMRQANISRRWCTDN